jgi:hypothetical protein
MLDESVLREKAVGAVRSGKLPIRRPDRTWRGPGLGPACGVCELPGTRSELEHEFEMQVMRDGDNPASTRFTFASGASRRGTARDSCEGSS